MLYDEAGRKAGGIHAEDRHGVQRFFPCTSLSLGVAQILPGSFRHPEEVANLAARAKHEAKQSRSGIAVLPCPATAPDRGLAAPAPPQTADALVA